MTDAVRFCPLCGDESRVAYCEKDGTRTVARRDLAAGTASLTPGDVVDERYRITGLLGRGGFGAVYAAEHTGTGQAIAVKVMVVGDDGDPDMGAVRRFYKEARVTAQLRHPNTVRVFDVGQTASGALFIAMELLHGDTLEERLVAQAERGQTLSERTAVSMATAVLRSLAEAHARGLVHRDLKPANIILSEVTPDEDTIPKVLDFGIARTQDSSLTGQGTALGTPAYMSPEQCMGAAVDGRSDLYSLGVILYRCVTGRLPFADRNPLTVMYKHAHAEPESIDTISNGAVDAELAEIIHRAMAKAPSARFDSAKEMRAALEMIGGGAATEPYEAGATRAAAALGPTGERPAGVSAETGGGDARPGQRPSWGPWLGAGALFLGIAVIAIGAWSWFDGGRAHGPAVHPGATRAAQLRGEAQGHPPSARQPRAAGRLVEVGAERSDAEISAYERPNAPDTTAAGESPDATHVDTSNAGTGGDAAATIPSHATAEQPKSASPAAAPNVRPHERHATRRRAGRRAGRRARAAAAAPARLRKHAETGTVQQPSGGRRPPVVSATPGGSVVTTGKPATKKPAAAPHKPVATKRPTAPQKTGKPAAERPKELD